MQPVNAFTSAIVSSLSICATAVIVFSASLQAIPSVQSYFIFITETVVVRVIESPKQL